MKISWARERKPSLHRHQPAHGGLLAGRHAVPDAITALTERNLWPAVKDWLEETSYGDFFIAAQDIREDHPAFKLAIAAAQSRFGFTDEQVAAVLFAHVRAVNEKDIRLFSAGDKRQQNRREREEHCRDAAANLPRHLSLLNSHHLCAPLYT